MLDKVISMVLLATKREFDEGAVKKCLNEYASKKATNQSSIEWFIFFDQGDVQNYESLKQYENLSNFGKINIFSLNISEEDNLYYTKTKCPIPSKLPKLGLSSGPNTLFFNSMDFLSELDHEHFLVIECDTKPLKEFWFDLLSDFCRSNNFFIAGSMYKGELITTEESGEAKSNEVWSGHLNGVAIYRNDKTISSVFWKKVRNFIESSVSRKKQININYDIATHFFSSTYDGKKICNTRNKPESDIIDTDIICNYSLPEHASVDELSILQKYPDTIILHKKSQSQTKENNIVEFDQKTAVLVLLTTEKEHKSGLIKNCLNSYFSLNPSKQHKIDLIIFFDQFSDDSYKELYKYKELNAINSVQIFCLNLKDEENLYFSGAKYNSEYVPRLGLSAGPNNLFFKSLRFLFKTDYEYFIVIESDTHPVRSLWFDLIASFCKTNDFLIAGSTYKGGIEIPKNCGWDKHINGVGIYKNSQELKDILDGAEEYIANVIAEQKSKCFLNYDVGVHFYSKTLQNHRIVDTNIITNASPSQDSTIPKSEILSKHQNTIILHQKDPKTINKFILLSSIYPENNPARRAEFLHCLKTNFDNSSIDQIILFSESQPSQSFGAEIDQFIKEKSIRVVYIQNRPTYHDFFLYSNAHLSGRKIIIANTDIYFDDSISHIAKSKIEKEFYVLTRWMKGEGGGSYLPHVFNSSVPIDRVDASEMLGLRWWTEGLLEGTRHGKLHTIDSSFEKRYQEGWSKRTNSISNAVDFDFHDPKTSAPGLDKIHRRPVYWRNEYSADTWIFRAPFLPNSNSYKIPLGTFRCDTYLNYFLIREAQKGLIKVSNPCLSVKSFHHDFLRSDEDKNYVQKNIEQNGVDIFTEELESSNPDELINKAFIPWEIF
jgi:hypothetical protein